MSLSGLTQRRHSTLRALARLVDLCFFGRLASSSSDVTTRDPLAAIVRRIAGPIRHAYSMSSMLLAHWKQRRQDAAFSPHAGQWSTADCESVHGSLRWQRPAGVPDRVRSCARRSVAVAATAAGMSLVCCAIGHHNSAHGDLRSSRLLATLLSHASGPIQSSCHRLC
jgi:hypothetical protein